MALKQTAFAAALCLYTVVNGNVASAHSTTILQKTIDISGLTARLDVATPRPDVLQPRDADWYRHRRHTEERATTRPSYGRLLSSRGGTFGMTGPTTVVGRLGTVLIDNSPIYGDRTRYNRILSVVPKGQNIAITGESGDNYCVLMYDHSTGFIAKEDVRLLDLQVVNTGESVENSLQANGAAPNASPNPSANSLGERLVSTATTFLGVPYLYGGETRSGIDCSAFVQTVYAENGISLPRVSRDQANVGYSVPLNDVSQWVPGDRLYFACHHPEIDHTGMYIGNGLFIHASAGHDYQVAIDNVDNSYYRAHLVAVRRSQELLGEVETSPNLVASQPGAPAPNAPSITTINGSKVSQTPLAAPNMAQQASAAPTAPPSAAPQSETAPSTSTDPSSAPTPSISISTDQDSEASQQ